MGVHYSAHLAHGLLIPGDEGVELALDVDDMYEWLHQNTPPGFTYVVGGGYGEGESYVISSRRCCVEVMNSSMYGFTSFEIKDPPQWLSLPEQDALRNFSKQHGLEYLMGWWGVSSCG